MKCLKSGRLIIRLAIIFLSLSVNSSYGQESRDRVKIQLSLSTTVFSTFQLKRIQSYSPGVLFSFRRHTIYGKFDIYDKYYFNFNFTKRTPLGFQIGYRYSIIDLFPKMTLFGDLNYRHLSYFSDNTLIFHRIKTALSTITGFTSYANMGTIMLGLDYSLLPFLSLSISGGYGLAHIDQYFIAIDSSNTTWEDFIPFSFGIRFLMK